MSIEIRKAGISSTRPCRYSLGLQDDRVFADFDVDNNDRVFLARISFDGYGCCPTTGKVSGMAGEFSKSFIRLIETNEVSSGELATILSQYFRENSNVIWKDALEDHDLLAD